MSNDTSLRAAIKIAQSSYSTRGDALGKEIEKVLSIILETTMRMDQAKEIK